MLFAELVATSEEVTRSSGRLAKTRLLADFLHHASPEEAAIAINYLSGILPQGRIGIGIAKIMNLRQHPAGTPSLTIVEVDRCFSELAATTGSGSAAARGLLLGGLFARATAAEQSFLARLIVGELRQGALEGIMVEAVARAADVPVELLRRALMMTGSLVEVARAALAAGAPALKGFSIQLLKPVAPMLAQPAGGIAEALQRLGEASFEWKIDGARIQLHKMGAEVRVFSRNLNEVSVAVPELVEQARLFNAESIILDGEAIALHQDGSPYPFQTTMSRFGRKLDVEKQRQLLPLSPFYFDCLYLNGEPLIDHPQRERFRILAGAVPPELVIPRLVTAEPERAEDFFADVLRRGHEGVMAKALDAPYEAGRRGFGWLKVKPVQTLDLVVLAAEWGHGRRSGMLSNLHLGARDPRQRRVRHAGEDLQGDDRQDARLADREAPGTGGQQGLLHGPRAAGADGGGGLQRHPGEPPLPRRLRPALRPRQALPPRQAPRRGRHHRHRAAAL
jgi:DNA ligase 1